MANHQDLFCVGGVKGLREVSQDETSPKYTKWKFLNTNYGGSPSSVLGFVMWRTQRGESGRDFRQNTQNNFLKYQLWRITKLCFVLVVWRVSERRVRTNFRPNTQNKFFKYQLWRITKLCFVLVVWRDSERRVRTNFRQNTQNKFLKYQLWRITKLCFVWVVWRDSERRVRTNFRQNTQNTFSKYQLWRISELCFVLVVWRGLREASQEQGAPEKKKQVWRLIQGCFFFFFFFFQFCEIGGLAIVIHKRNLTNVPRNSGAKFRQNNT